MKYPISHSLGKTLGEFFYDILTFHVPPSKDVALLDPTCGKKYLWSKFFEETFFGKPIEQYGRVVFSDIKDCGQELISDIEKLSFNHEFDGIIYDPPYLFGYVDRLHPDNPRKDDYGGYCHDYTNLLRFMNVANDKFPFWLKLNGKVIVKCSDQYGPDLRKYYPLHITWVERLSNFDLIDSFIYLFHNISPTAFQVKDRPCSVIMHTYFLVFKVK